MPIRVATLGRAIVCLLGVAIYAPSGAETCISPYVKALKEPEKVMYLWALPAKGVQGNDFLAVIDVDIASATYGKILNKIPVGSAGNEAHHIGYTDDRTKIWAASLNSNRFFLFDVASDPRNPKLIRTIGNVAKLTGLTGPHTPYAIPGRILISMASGPDGTGPGGLAEFTNDGRYVASHRSPDNIYEPVIKPEFNRMVTSAWVPQKTFMTPGNKWDPKDFSNTMQVWDLKERKIIQTLNGDPITIAQRWMLAPGARHGYSISFAGNSIWMFRMGEDGTFTHKKAADLRPGCLPADLRQSPDDKLPLHQLLPGQRDPGLGRLRPGEHQVARHDSGRGPAEHDAHDCPTAGGCTSPIRRSARIDYSPRYAMQLIQVGPDGRMKLDPNFKIDFSRKPDGPARPHDMLLN